MIKQIKHLTILIAINTVFCNTAILAEHNLQIGIVGSTNSSFYKGVGNNYYMLPLIIADYNQFYLQGTQAGYRFYNNKKQGELAVEVRYSIDGYHNDDSIELNGMNNRNAALEAGLIYKTGILDGLAKFNLMQDISNKHSGLSAEIDYERPFWNKQDMQLSWYTGSQYWSSKKTDYYFGVNAEESTRLRPVYSADESYRLYLGSNMIKRFNSDISLIASVEYLWASDEIDKSPLTTEQHQWSGYMGIFYKF